MASFSRIELTSCSCSLPSPFIIASAKRVNSPFQVHSTAKFPYGFVFEHVEMIDIEPVVSDRRFGG